MRNLKARMAQQGSARDVGDHSAFMIQKGNAQNNHRPGLLDHSQVHQPDFTSLEQGHYEPAFSSSSYIEKISAEALTICWYSSNHAANSFTSAGERRSIADSISAIAVMPPKYFIWLSRGKRYLALR